MKKTTMKAFFVLGIFLFCVRLWADQPVEHFYNDPNYIEVDPNYTPGSFPLSDVNDARTYFYIKKAELVKPEDSLKWGRLFSLGLGKLTFTSLKNKTVPVLGYFRSYSAILDYDQNRLIRLQMVIDVNSLDTAVPGRNNRLLGIFFKSMTPSLGTAIVDLDQLDMKGESLQVFGDGKSRKVFARGSILLNEVVRPIEVELEVVKTEETWVVKMVEPLNLMISDFGFGDRVYELLRSCNHKSISNAVKINAELYFK